MKKWTHTFLGSWGTCPRCPNPISVLSGFILPRPLVTRALQSSLFKGYVLGLTAALLLVGGPLWAHENEVSIREEDGKRIIEGNGLPDHRTGRFPNRDNPNTISPQRVHFEMTLDPQKNPQFTPAGGMVLGVAANGLKFDSGTAEYWGDDPHSIWREEAIVDGRGRLGIDQNNAHVQPTGTYHYHGIPEGFLKQIGDRDAMILIGWAADGFPIYGPKAYKDPDDTTSGLVKMKPSYQLKSGQRPSGKEGPGGRYDGSYTPDFEFVEGLGDLDEANGREGITPEYPDGTYYYVLTDEFPYVPRFFRGTPDPSFRLGPPGGGGRGGPGGPGGRGGPGGHGPPPPRGGPRGPR